MAGPSVGASTAGDRNDAPRHIWVGEHCDDMLIGDVLLISLSYKLRLRAIITCVVYIVHMCALNSPKPLTKGVLMDNVPENEHARWNALESINRRHGSG